MAAALAAFAWLLYDTHSRGAGMLAHDEAVKEAFRQWVAGRPTEPLERDGYRFEFVSGDGLPAVWLARPLRPGEDGERWFLSAGGLDFYEFDTVLYEVPGHHPDVEALRSWLALPDDRREGVPRPFGWRSADRPYE